jgi:hypothetical protein
MQCCYHSARESLVAFLLKIRPARNNKWPLSSHTRVDLGISSLQTVLLKYVCTVLRYLISVWISGCRSQWLRCLRRVSTADRLLGLRVRISPGAWMVVRCERCVCCQVEVSATGWSLVQRSPTDCGASLRVNSEPQEWGGLNPQVGCKSQ